MLRNRALIGLAIAATMLSACHRKQTPAQPTPPPPDGESTSGATPVSNATPSNPTTNSNNSAEMARLRSTLQEMVFFDYDQSTIRDDSKSVLDAKRSEERGVGQEGDSM